MRDRCPLPSWICPPLGLVGQAWTCWEPEALPDPALPCGLILLSSASYSTREGLRGRIRSEEGAEPAFHSALHKTEKMSRVHNREWARGHGSHTDRIGGFLEGTDFLT